MQERDISSCEIQTVFMVLSCFTELHTPTDLGVVTALTYNASSSNLIAASIDKHVLLHDCSDFDRPGTQIPTALVVLSMAVTASGATFMGTNTGVIAELDLENLKVWNEAQDSEKGAVAAILAMGNSIVSVTYDGTLATRDAHSKSVATRMQAEHRVFAMDVAANYIVLGMSERKVHIYDSRKMDQPVQRRETGLKQQTSALSCLPDGSGYAVSTIDGRVAIEYLDPSPAVQARKYAFKCHRVGSKTDPEDTVYPVNALQFDSKHESTLYTGGSDGAVCIWDWHARRRTKQHGGFANAVTKLQVCGNALAVAVCDDRHRIGQPATDASKLYIMN